MEINHPERQRDLDLIRLILLDLAGYGVPETELRKYTPDQLALHGAYLKDAGFVHANISDENGVPKAVGYIRLTWQGHEFVELSRENEAWQKSKDALMAAGVWNVALLSDLLRDAAKERLRQPGTTIVTGS